MPTILVVDDSPTALQTIQAILADAGHEVVACNTGRGAVETVRKRPFDLLVTDIYMPDHDGLEVIQACRRLRPALPVVAISGVTGKRDMLGVARRLGACQTVVKPCSRADLLDAVAAALKAPAPAAPPAAGSSEPLRKPDR